MNKFSKKEPINFHKCYDGEGATQLPLRTNHFAYLRSKFDNQYSCVAMSFQGHLIVVSVQCDISKGSFKDTSLEMNKFPKKVPVNFHKCYDSEGAIQLLLWSNRFVNPAVRQIFSSDDHNSCVNMSSQSHLAVRGGS